MFPTNLNRTIFPLFCRIISSIKYLWHCCPRPRNILNWFLISKEKRRIFWDRRVHTAARVDKYIVTEVTWRCPLTASKET